MDLKIVDGNSKFKCRTNGVILKDNKILVVQIANNPFYCLPGGHIELGEDSKNAVAREMKEETRLNVKPEKLISIVEGFFKGTDGKNFHEISFYYLLTLNENVETKDYEYQENDKGKLVTLKFKWIDCKDIDKIDFRPDALINKIKSQNWDFEHIISYQ